MSDLLSKIESISGEAADGLKQAGLLTDSDIKPLSRDDLRDLFPGNDKFQMRRSIYEIIHTPEPVGAVFKELTGFVPRESLHAALKNEKVLDYLHMLKEMKAHVENIQGFFQAHIDNLEEFKNAEQQQKPDKDPVSDTSSSIQHDPMELEDSQNGGQSQEARDRWTAAETSGANGPVGPYSGPNDHNSQEASDFSSGTGSSGGSGAVVPYSDPNGHYSQGGRDTSSGTGSSGASGPIGPYSDPNDHYSQGGRDFSSGTGSSGGSGAIVPYSDPNGHYSQGGRDTSSGTGSSGASGAVVPYSGPNNHYSQGGRGSWRGFSSGVPPQRVQVMYRSVVSGKTFGAHLQLMTKVEQQDQDRVQLVERKEDHKVTVLFCPISSRVGADVDAAMSDVEDDDKEIILVLMHHVREPKPTTNIRTWNDYKRVVLHVHVFYHETNNGLLSCPQNNDAVLKIQNELLNYSFPKFQATSGNALGVGEGRRRSTNRGGNNSSGRSSSSSTSWFPNLFSRS